MAILSEIIPSIRTLLGAPFQEVSLLWQVAPLLFLWVVLEIYFGMYKGEKLGWNSALANGITMFWIVLSGLQFAFSNQDALRLNWPTLGVLFTIGIYALFIMVVSFKHRFSSNVTFFLASPTFMYYLAIISLLVAHQLIPLTLPMLLAILIMLVFFEGLFLIVRKLIPDDKTLDDFDTDWDAKSDFDDKFAFPEHDTPSFEDKGNDPFLDEKKEPSPLEMQVEKTSKTQHKNLLKTLR